MAKNHKPAAAHEPAAHTDSSTAPDAPTAGAEEMVLVHNQSEGELHHNQYRLRPGHTIEVPASIANIWLGVTHLGRPRVILASDMLKGAKTITAAQAAAIKAENEALLSQKDEGDRKIANLEKLVKQLQGQIASPGKKDEKPSASPDAGGSESTAGS